MSADTLFSAANVVAALAWLALIVGGRTRAIAGAVAGAAIPLLLAVVYVAVVATHIGGSDGGFGSIPEVRELFSDDWLLLAGWVHYLAFDLFVGSWQVRDAQRHSIPHLLVVPGLILTFLFGPAGLLLYYGVRLKRTQLFSPVEAKVGA